MCLSHVPTPRGRARKEAARVCGGCVCPLYAASGRVCVCACVYALKVARVDGWAGGGCSYAWGGWFACVGAYMCGHGVGVIMWQMVAVVCVCVPMVVHALGGVRVGVGWLRLCVCVQCWGGKRIGIGAKNESKTDSQIVKKAQISAVLIKSLDNPFKLSHNGNEQEQKTKDNTNEKIQHT